jgi:hypothetical protein
MKGLGSEARALLEEASRQEALPSAKALGRVRRSIAYQAMAASVAVATSSASVGAKAGAFGAGITLQLASFVLSGAITGGAVVAVSSHLASPAASKPTPSIVVASPTAAPPAVLHDPPSLPSPTATSPTPEPAPRAASVTEQRAERTPRLLAPRTSERAPSGEPAASVVVKPPTTVTLQVEVLREARNLLLSHRALDALMVLDQYEDLFRQSPLEEQACAAHIAALCQLGRPEQAQSEINALAQRWPHSQVAARLASTCANGANREGKP